MEEPERSWYAREAKRLVRLVCVSGGEVRASTLKLITCGEDLEDSWVHLNGRVQSECCAKKEQHVNALTEARITVPYHGVDGKSTDGRAYLFMMIPKARCTPNTYKAYKSGLAPARAVSPYCPLCNAARTSITTSRSAHRTPSFFSSIVSVLVHVLYVVVHAADLSPLLRQLLIVSP